MILQSPIFSGSIQISGSFSVNSTDLSNGAVSSSYANTSLTSSHAVSALSSSHAVTSSNTNLATLVHNSYLLSGSLKFWSGPQQVYDSFSGSADPNTVYFIQ